MTHCKGQTRPLPARWRVDLSPDLPAGAGAFAYCGGNGAATVHRGYGLH